MANWASGGEMPFDVGAFAAHLLALQTGNDGHRKISLSL
jgi:hypothetical protein